MQMETEDKTNLESGILKVNDGTKNQFREKMNDKNKKVYDILTQKDKDTEDNIKEAVKYMFTDEKTGKKLSYPEMRYLYG